MEYLKGVWQGLGTLHPRRFICGFCGANVGSASGYWVQGHPEGTEHATTRMCPNCNRPTYFEGDSQFPGVRFGRAVKHLPPEVQGLYEEARSCMSVDAYTAAVMAARKILMNVAVSQGDKPGKRYAEYVDWLEANHFVPPGGKKWVDHIRDKGNDANHEIPNMTKADAETLINFVEMLLKFIYEFPATVA